MEQQVPPTLPHNPPFLALFWAGRWAIGLSANTFGFMVYWIVEHQTHQIRWLLLLGLLAMGAHFFSGVGGAWVDRYPPSLLMKVYPTALATVLCIIALIGRQSLPFLITAYTFVVVLQNAWAPLLRVVPLAWVPRSQWGALNAIGGIVGRLAVVSSGLVDLIIFRDPTAFALRVMIPMSAAVVAGLLWIPVNRARPVNAPERATTHESRSGSTLNRQTLADLWRLSAFRNLTLLLAIGNVFIMPFLHLLPAWSAQVIHTGDTGYFTFQMSSAAGLLVGYALAYLMTRRSCSMFHGIVTGLLLQLAVVSFPWLRGFWLPMAVVLLMGLSDGIQDTYILTMLQQFVPDTMQGRMFGTLTLIVGGVAGPAGIGFLMLLSLWLTIIPIFILSSLGIGVVTLILIRYATVSLGPWRASHLDSSSSNTLT